MPLPIVPVGAVPKLATNFGQWFLLNALPIVATRLRPILENPEGTVQRLGDLVVWQGPSGQKVLGMLGGISESQTRIEGAVERIEAAQIGMSSTLDTVLNLSLFSIGFSALAGGFMLARLRSLERRLQVIGQQVADIKDHLDAMSKAVLANGLTLLDRFEKKRDRDDLKQAFAGCNSALSLYQTLTANEIAGPQRLPVLNQCGRCYLLALTATIRCRAHLHDWDDIEHLVAVEQATMVSLGKKMFGLVLGKSPEVYLEPRLQADGVTLEVMTEVYRQAYLAKAVEGNQVRDSGQMFEQLRERVYGASRGVLFSNSGRLRRQLLANLKYLIAALEDINRVESIRVRLVEARARGVDPATLEQEIERSLPELKEAGVFAFAWPPEA